MGLPSEPSRGGARAAPAADADAAREEFLYHLYRGSGLLQDGRVHEAKEELESALRLQPLEPKGQDLLAVVYFRLGLYPRAIDIFSELVKAFPRERTPRINLALCYLKTGQCQRARELLEETALLHPDYDRGWAYLGLAYEGLGDLWRAREAFLRAGQAGMARRMEERMGMTADPGGDVETPTVERYYAAFGAIEAAPSSLGLTPEPGPVPPARAPSQRPPSALPPPLHDRSEARRAPAADPPAPAIGGDPSAERFLRQRQAHWPRGAAPFVQHEPSGHLYVRLEDLFVCRPEAICALSPPADEPWQIEPWLPPTGDRPSPGGGYELVRVAGRGHAMLAPGAGRTLAGLPLNGGPLWVGWGALTAFAASLSVDRAVNAIDDASAAPAWARLEGRGLVVLGLPARHVAFRVGPGEPVVVRRGALCGWWGALAAQPVGGAPGVSEPGRGFVWFSGEGFVLATGGG
jgi:hypothetical protein